MTRSDRRTSAGVFLLVLAIYGLVGSGHTNSNDEESTLAMTMSLIETRSPVVNPQGDEEWVVFPIRPGRTGEPVAITGLGQAAAGIPTILAGRLFSHVLPSGWREYSERLFLGWTNSIITAAGVAFVYLIAALLGAHRRRALVLAFVYGLGTYALPHSRTFMSEPFATTFTLAGTYFVLRGAMAGKRADLILGGGLAGLAILGRATAGLFPPVLAVYLLLSAHRRVPLAARVRPVVYFGVGVLPPWLLFLAGNWWRFGSPTDFGYPRVPQSFPILEGLQGLFLSPGKSVFLYAPCVLVGLVAAPFAWRKQWRETFVLLSLAAVNTLFFARVPFWHGDNAWGPRYLLMSLPFYALLVAPLLSSNRWFKALLVSAVIGIIPAGLGTMMSWNQYFTVVAANAPRTDPAVPPPQDELTHHQVYWSQLVGHAREMPGLVRNTWDRLDGRFAGDPYPEPPGIGTRYFWYWKPPQLDIWWYYVFPIHAPKQVLLLIPMWLVVGALGVRKLRSENEIAPPAPTSRRPAQAMAVGA